MRYSVLQIVASLITGDHPETKKNVLWVGSQAKDAVEDTARAARDTGNLDIWDNFADAVQISVLPIEPDSRHRRHSSPQGGGSLGQHPPQFEIRIEM